MLHVLGCITGQHDLRLVALAGALCLMACFTAASMILRARAAQQSTSWLWLAAAGSVFGCGVWATHFIAMLAYRSGLPQSFDGPLTFLSIAIAAVVSGLGFAVAVRRAPLLGGAVAGIAISAMHYVGMAALRIPARADWNQGYVIASVVVGTVLAAMALHVMLRRHGFRALSLGAATLTVAIVGMHFTAMSAVTYIPDSSVVVPPAFIDPPLLAIAIASVAILIVGLGLIGAIVDYHLALRAMSETERLKSHIAELERTKSALEKTSVDLSAALFTASSANETKARFLASMSHELRTPLNAIIGFSDFLLLEAYGPLGNVRYAEYVRDIRESGTLLLSLINDILDLSRLDAGQTILKDEPIDLGELIAETSRMLRLQVLDAGLTISEDIYPELPHIRGDRRRIQQVFLNLMTNAIKFTPLGGSIRIAAFERAGEIAASVSDTGIGIAKGDIPRALERFGQVDTRIARKYQGAGLGLPLARQLMELHGGSFTLESEPDHGTTVTVGFPADRIVATVREVA